MDKRERFTKLVMKLNNVLRPKLRKAEIGSPEWHELGDMYKLIADEAAIIEGELAEDDIAKIDEALNSVSYEKPKSDDEIKTEIRAEIMDYIDKTPGFKYGILSAMAKAVDLKKKRDEELKNKKEDKE